MKVQFNVQMTRQYLFDFFLQHTYRTLRGKLSLLAGLAMIPLCVLTWNRVGRMFSVCYIFFAVFFLLLMPGKLWIKADQGFKRTMGKEGGGGGGVIQSPAKTGTPKCPVWPLVL